MCYVYNKIMASLQRRIVHGHAYYYLVESRRVNGRPRPIVVAYLGSADTLLKRLQQTSSKPLRAQVTQFGGVAALYELAQQLELLQLIDQNVPKRKQGPSLGQYMLVAAINRCLAPTSKLRMPGWLKSTPLPRWMGLSAQQFSAPRFWDNMDLLTEEKIQAISEALSRRVIDKFQVDLSSLVFDCTNFDTFLDTENPSQLAQRGHAKSKRADLRIVGLALLVSVDFHVPLLWKVYPGNQHDSQSFAQVLKELTARFQVFARECESITLVCDKGNNSARNQEMVDHSGLHFVGSLVPSHYPDLLAIPRKKFRGLQDARLKSIRAYRLKREVWEKERTLLITFSPELQRKQRRGMEQHLAKKRRRLQELQAKLWRSQKPGAKGKGYTCESLTKHARQICSGQYMAQLLHVSVKQKRKRLELSYRTDAAALARIHEQQLGKRILFTDQDEWTNHQIVLGYRSQSHVEDAFRTMKDPHFVSWEPMFHWTDSKIRVHAFYCVLALTLASLLQRQAAQKGIALSVKAMFEALNAIEEVVNIYSARGETGSRGRPHTETTLSEMNATQQTLYRLFNLDRYRRKS
jgi:transposase